MSDSKNKDVGDATITVRFKGNYKDSKPETTGFSITPAVFGRDIIARDVAAAAKKSSQKPLPLLIWAETGKSVGSRFFKVTYNGADSVTDAGIYDAVIRADNKNYTGQTSAKVTLVSDNKLLLSKAKVTFTPKSYSYTGEKISPSYNLSIGGKTLTEGTDYRLAEENLYDNQNPGTATAVFEAISGNPTGYVGTRTATFKITGNREIKEEGEGSDFTYTFEKDVPYAKGGAKPAVIVSDNGVRLIEGRDYTLSYAKNRAVTNGEETAQIKVKGKGNYKKTVTLKFAIRQQSFSALGGSITVADQFRALSKLKKPSVTVYDIDGKKLKAGTDYTVLEPDLSASDNTEESGTVYLAITGKGSYTDDDPVTVSFRYMQTVSSNLGKAKMMKQITDRDYNGNPVRLNKNDLKEILYNGKKASPEYLVPGEDFKVTGYRNNVKKGTAKADLQGIGNYAGTKTLTFKIKEKKVDYKGALIGDKWK